MYTYKEKQASKIQSDVHEFLRGMSIGEALPAIAAYIEAQPELTDAEARQLVEFSRRMSKIAWKYV
ncbi:MAG: hypothetical protein GY813_09365 [Halieaceae bacterium]|nr:hypothetical protein [Halieaceae bacterium]